MRTFLLFILMMNSMSLFSLDEIRIARGESEGDRGQVYSYRILDAALEATVEEFGPYEIKYTGLSFSRNRALSELVQGKFINVHEAATRSDWEEQALPVRIPVRKGLLSYKIFLIVPEKQKIFSQIESLDQLKALSAGLGSQWSATLFMRKAGFTIVTSTEYESLFKMLSRNRFDYFPRGVSEIYGELECISDQNMNIVMEKDCLLYVLNPSYFFVSPRYPELAERIRVGLDRIIDNGVFESLFNEEYGDIIIRLEMDKRKLFYVETDSVPAETPLSVEKYWYKP